MKEINSRTQVVIASYELAKSLIESKKHLVSETEARFGTIILDESHYIKTADAARAKNALKLCHTAKKVILLSGTPALARPMELYTQISAINKSLFPSRKMFTKLFFQSEWKTIFFKNLVFSKN